MAQRLMGLSSMSNIHLYPMLLALSFLHCKNVTMRREDPCHQRKPPKHPGDCQRLHYHVLDIQPMQKVLHTEGHSHTTGLQKALHICRGHFKDYREKGLFGRNKGLYWWDSQVRGKSTAGITVKDYNVKGKQPA